MSPAPPLTELEAAVAREIVRLARAQLPVEGDLGLEEAAALASALDSLQLLALVVAVEDRFRLVLSEEDAAGTRTLADLARLVAARAEPATLPGPGAEAAP